MENVDKKLKKNNRGEEVNQEIEKFLRENPNLKKAMDIFSMSMEEYTKAMSALTKKNVIVSFTNTNGDVAGN